MFGYTIELNIKNIDGELINAMKLIGMNHEFNVLEHGKDRLVFTNDSGRNFTSLVNSLSMVCKAYGVDYMSLLDLD